MSEPLVQTSERPVLRVVSGGRNYKTRRARAARLRGALTTLAAVAAIGMAGVAGVRALTTQSPAPVMVTRTVQPGDTLWSLARRYGDPSKNVLDRIDNLSRVNGLAGASTLVPGQRLVIPVENPVEVALIQRTVAAAEQSRQ